jgi:hypothetical protein
VQHLGHDHRYAVHLESFDHPLLLVLREVIQQQEQIPAGIVRQALEIVQHDDRLGRHPHGEHRADRSAGQLLERSVSGGEFLRSHRGGVAFGRRIVPVGCPEQRVLR